MDLEIILTGSFGVGKSSIYNRFIYNEYSNKYYGTLGVRANEKILEVGGAECKFKVWDIAGEVSQEKVPKSYFHTPTIIVYVIDLNRSFGLEKIPADLEYLKGLSDDKKIYVIGNKIDLVEKQTIDQLLVDNPWLDFFSITSAKTGENISELFSSIAMQEIESSLKKKQ